MKPGIYYIVSTRIKSYLPGLANQWKCPQCGYGQGESDGPPSKKCYNCGLDFYVDQTNNWTYKINIFIKHDIFHFRILERRIE